MSRTLVFFYGLFMDEGLLLRQGLNPKVIGRARLDGFALRIRDRATLVVSSGDSAYGMLIELEDEEIERLYASPGVDDYVPETIQAIVLSNQTTRSAVCYNLPEKKAAMVANRDYAEKLAELVLTLGFPSEYARDIRGESQ